MGTPLAEALAAGDREAFAALYDRLGPIGVAITLPLVAGASVLARVEPPSLEARLRAAGLADDVRKCLGENL